MNFWRKNRVNNEGDDFCQQFCSRWLLTIGVSKGKSWTPYSIFVLSTLIMSFICWAYSFCKSENSTHILHRLCLDLLAIGLFFTNLSQNNNLFKLAQDADKLFIYKDPDLKEIYKSYSRQLFKSWMKKYTDIFSVLVCLAWLNILYENMKLTVFTSADLPPPGMVPIMNSTIWSVSMHVAEILFIVNAILVDIMVLQIFLVLNLQLIANLKTLSAALKRIHLKPYGSTYLQQEITQLVNECAKHHQLILKTFDGLKEIYSVAFHIIYFGMIWAIAFCRTLIIVEHVNIINLLPLFYLEMGYIHLFCAISDVLRETSYKISFAAYSNEWFTFPNSAKQSLILIMIRTAKLPKMTFFVGGNDVSCETFTAIINATLTFFMISIVMQ